MENQFTLQLNILLDNNGKLIDSKNVGDKLPKDFVAFMTTKFTEAMDISSMSTLTFSVDRYTVNDIWQVDENVVMLSNKAKANNTPIYTSITQVYDICDFNGNILAPGSTWKIRHIDELP